MGFTVGLGSSLSYGLTAATLALAGGGAAGDWKVPSRYAALCNPVPPDRAALEQGRRLYGRECSSCHGEHGAGDGKSARDLEKPVPDLALVELVDQPDGALFWKIGVGRKPMPGFKDLLTDEERWRVVLYLRELTSSRSPVTPEFALPEPFRKSLSAVTDGYLALGTCLASNDLEGVRRAAADLVERTRALAAAPLADLSSPVRETWGRLAPLLDETARDAAGTADLQGGRERFATLSAVLLDALEKLERDGDEPLFLFRGQHGGEGQPVLWIQRGTAPGNPYVGTSNREASRFACRLLARREAGRN